MNTYNFLFCTIIYLFISFLHFNSVYGCTTRTNNVEDEWVRIDRTDLDFLKMGNFQDDSMVLLEKGILADIGVKFLYCYGEIVVRIIINKNDFIDSLNIMNLLNRIFSIAKEYLILNLADTVCTRSQLRMLLGCSVQYGLIISKDKDREILSDFSCKRDAGLLNNPPNENNMAYRLLKPDSFLTINLSNKKTNNIREDILSNHWYWYWMFKVHLFYK